MKIKSLTKTRLKSEIIPFSIKANNSFTSVDGEEIQTEGFCFSPSFDGRNDFFDYKFVRLKFNNNIYIFRVLPTRDGERRVESVFGADIIVAHNGTKKDLYFNSFIDAAIGLKNKEIRVPIFFLPELCPIPSEDDTRIVLHHQLKDGSFSFGRLYRFFSLEDKDILIEKYVILELEDGTRRIAIIKEINKETKNVVFDIIRFGAMCNFTNEKNYYGAWEGEFTGEYFTAYENFMDVKKDYFLK